MGTKDSEKVTYEERRRHPRLDVTGSASVVAASGLFNLELANISAGGALLRGAGISLDEGDTVLASLDLGLSEDGQHLTITIDGRVVRNEESLAIALQWEQPNGNLKRVLELLGETVH